MNREGPHLGVVLPQSEIRPSKPSEIRRFAEAVAAAGFDHLLAFEHVVGADSASRPGWDGYYDHTTPFLEPFTLFAYLGATTGLEMVTDVLVLPQRQTMLVAKQAATLDILLEGRLRLGIGIGWNEVEYEALGFDFRRRAARFEEQIPLLRRLWTEPVVSHDGVFDRVDRAGLEPRPGRLIPLWIGCGDAAPALQRVGRLADGWIPHPALGDGRRLAAAWAEVRRAVEMSGRDPLTFGLQGQVHWRGSNEADLIRKLDRWVELGATHVSINSLEAGLSWPDGHLEVCAGVGDAWAHLTTRACRSPDAALTIETPTTAAERSKLPSGSDLA